MVEILALQGRGTALSRLLADSLTSVCELILFFSLHYKLFLKSSSGNKAFITRGETVEVDLFF